MKPHHFLNALDEEKILASIRAAEARTSGEIRVNISRRLAHDPLLAAQKRFHRFGMAQTRDRNAVLIYIAPNSRTFAIIGDVGIHEKCGQAFWDDIASTLTEHFKRDDFTGGLIAAIERTGALLAQQFPRRDDDKNELSDEIM